MCEASLLQAATSCSVFRGGARDVSQTQAESYDVDVNHPQVICKANLTSLDQARPIFP